MSAAIHTQVNLTFPGVIYGAHETPWDLQCLLYIGGAATPTRMLQSRLAEGLLGEPVASRLPLVAGIHNVINGALVSGGARMTARTSIRCIRYFYAWMDEYQRHPTEDSITLHYISWCEHLEHRSRMLRQIAPQTARDRASATGSLIGQALGLSVSLFRQTRLWRVAKPKPNWSAESEKLNLTDTLDFGHLLVDICDGLDVAAIHGPLPIQIPLRSGQVLTEWLRLYPPENLRPDSTASTKRLNKKVRERLDRDVSNKARTGVITLRVEAEMLIFIAQTGMNLAQANRLRIGSFSFQRYQDGYRIRRMYKGRRQGQVEFEIFREYRPYFERYLRWRETIFGGGPDALLFPAASGRSPDIATVFKAVQKRCKKVGLPYVGPRTLRKARVNWLRRSLGAGLAAEMAQHSEATLLRHYDVPSHQNALVEVGRFMAAIDPSLESAGPGQCLAVNPKREIDAPDGAPSPDCISPAGCMFCSYNRDLCSFDHVWSLTTYRHLKVLELSRYRPPERAGEPHPALLVIGRVTAKLDGFKSSEKINPEWLVEAAARVEEGNFHPKWDAFVQLLEWRTGGHSAC